MGDISKSVFTSEYELFLRLLREDRRAAGLNQREVAERLGKTVLYVSRCERGERRMDVLELREFCAAIGVNMVEFVQRLDASIASPRRRKKR